MTLFLFLLLALGIFLMCHAGGIVDEIQGIIKSTKKDDENFL